MYLSILTPLITFNRHAKAIIQKYERLLIEIPERNDLKLRVQIEPYKVVNSHVQQMTSYLEEHLREDLVGAYVHGSLGTYEEIAYSDFDTLVILKNEVFESSKRLTRTAHRLNCARTIMLGFDPLQHHGWFVLTEIDLKYYCNAYFPLELFKRAKSLFSNKGLDLAIALRESSCEIRMAFENMANTIIRKIKNRWYPTNLYQLKCLLSQFMLLPALYVQTKYGRGIYKKESFDLARVDFDSKQWAIMDKVSEIRADWNYKISPMKQWLMYHPHVLSRYVAKRFAPKIPDKIVNALTAPFYTDMGNLAMLMKEKLA